MIRKSYMIASLISLIDIHIPSPAAALLALFFFVAGPPVFLSPLDAQVTEPWRPLHGGCFSGTRVRESPDPLVSYRWDDPKAGDSLQIYTRTPVSMQGFPRSAFMSSVKEGGPAPTIPIAAGLSEAAYRGGRRPAGLADGGLIAGLSIAVKGTGSLRLDFGVECAGWLEFDSDDLPDSVEMSISEYNEPAIVNTGARHPIKTARPAKYGHTYRLELNEELYEGVRFGWIHVRRYKKTWHILNPRLVCQVRPVNYAGSFSCSDPELTRIWYTGAYTVRLNLLQHYFGAILMERSDRQSWTGDAYPAQAAALAAFGNDDFIRANIRITAGQDNGIASYPLYWVLSLVDYYRYTGDSSFFREYTGNADKKLERAYRHYDTLPSLGFMGWDERLGAGFEHPDAPEAQETYRMLCIHVWRKMAAAVLATGDTTLATKYEGYAVSKSRELFNADERAAASGIISSESAPVSGAFSFGIHAVSEAVNADLLQDPVVAARAKKWFADRLNRLSYSPFNQYFIIQAMASAGRYKEALRTIKDQWGGQLRYGGTSFFEVYRPSWNTILQKNDPPPNNQCGYTSLAHPWGAGVTKWLSENILGIRPSIPGFKNFVILPHLDGHLTWVRGEMPTPSGIISASFDSRSGINRFFIPPGLLAERIGIPRTTGTGRKIVTVAVNGRLLWSNTAAGKNAQQIAPEQAPEQGKEQAKENTKENAKENEVDAPPVWKGLRTVAEDSSYIYLLQVPPGDYSVKCAYEGINKQNRTGSSIVRSTTIRSMATRSMATRSMATRSVAARSGSAPSTAPRPGEARSEKTRSAETPSGDLAYPLPGITLDRLTGGDWRKKYGKDGYELFGYGAAGRSWPSYVEDIQYHGEERVVWDSAVNDSRVLTLPGSTPGSNSGKAAAIITGDPAPTRQTFTIDVRLKKEHPYYLTLYFLDWEGGKEPRRSALELFDLGTLNILAPVGMIRNYRQGRYVRFRFYKSVRVRIDQVRGVNAALSGIFFDPR